MDQDAVTRCRPSGLHSSQAQLDRLGWKGDKREGETSRRKGCESVVLPQKKYGSAVSNVQHQHTLDRQVCSPGHLFRSPLNDNS